MKAEPLKTASGTPAAATGTPAGGASPAPAPAGRPSPASDGKGTTPARRLAGLVSQLPRGEMKALSASEARELAGDLSRALRRYFEYADEAIWLTGRQSRKQPMPADWAIWSDIDAEELGTLVGAWLGAGQRSAVVAASVRNAVDLYKRLQVLIILGPKFKQTFAFYMAQGGIALPWQ